MVLLELEDVDDRAVFAGILVEFNNELQNAPAREVFPPGQRDDGFRRSYVMGPGKKPPRRQALFLEDEFGLPGAYGVRSYQNAASSQGPRDTRRILSSTPAVSVEHTPQAEEAGANWRRRGTLAPHPNLDSNNPGELSAGLLSITQSCCFTLISVVGSFVILQRLIARRHVRFTKESWRVVWPLVLVVCEALWEDNYIHPGHVFMRFGIHQLGKKQLRHMQWYLVTALEMRLHVDIVEFRHKLQYWQSLGKEAFDLGKEVVRCVQDTGPLANRVRMNLEPYYRAGLGHNPQSGLLEWSNPQSGEGGVNGELDLFKQRPLPTTEKIGVQLHLHLQMCSPASQAVRPSIINGRTHEPRLPVYEQLYAGNRAYGGTSWGHPPGAYKDVRNPPHWWRRERLMRAALSLEKTKYKVTNRYSNLEAWIRNNPSRESGGFGNLPPGFVWQAGDILDEPDDGVENEEPLKSVRTTLEHTDDYGHSHGHYRYREAFLKGDYRFWKETFFPDGGLQIGMSAQQMFAILADSGDPSPGQDSVGPPQGGITNGMGNVVDGDFRNNPGYAETVQLTHHTSNFAGMMGPPGAGAGSFANLQSGGPPLGSHPALVMPAQTQHQHQHLLGGNHVVVPHQQKFLQHHHQQSMPAPNGVQRFISDPNHCPAPMLTMSQHQQHQQTGPNMQYAAPHQQHHNVQMTNNMQPLYQPQPLVPSQPLAPPSNHHFRSADIMMHNFAPPPGPPAARPSFDLGLSRPFGYNFHHHDQQHRTTTTPSHSRYCGDLVTPARGACQDGGASWSNNWSGIGAAGDSGVGNSSSEQSAMRGAGLGAASGPPSVGAMSVPHPGGPPGGRVFNNSSSNGGTSAARRPPHSPSDDQGWRFRQHYQEHERRTMQRGAPLSASAVALITTTSMMEQTNGGPSPAQGTQESESTLDHHSGGRGREKSGGRPEFANGAARAGGRTIRVVPPAPAVRVVQPPRRSDLMPRIEESEFRGGSSESEVPDDCIPAPRRHVQFDAPDDLESPRMRGGPFSPTTRNRPLSRGAFTARGDEQAERHRKEMQALLTAAKKRPASNKKERPAPVPLVPNAQTAEHRAATMDKGLWGKRDGLQALKEGFKNQKPPNFTPQQKFRGTMAPAKVPAPVGTSRAEPPQQGGGVPAAAVPPAKSSAGSSPPRGNNVLLPRAARAAAPAAGGGCSAAS